MSKQRTAPALIGLAGGPGAGKDTAAGLLTTHHGFRQLAFADALRNFVYATDDGWRQAFDLYGYEVAKHTVEGFREKLIHVGEAARSFIFDRVWVEAVEVEIMAWHGMSGVSVVVSDVRYINEADMIRQHGGIIVGIDRPGHEPESANANEVFLTADEYVLNHGSLCEMWAELDALVDSLN